MRLSGEAEQGYAMLIMAKQFSHKTFNLMNLIAAALLLCGCESKPLKQVEKRIEVRNYFLFYCSSGHGRNLKELHNPANNPILNACLTGATYKDLKGLGIEDLAGRLQTLKDGQIIEEVNGRYYMAFPVVLGAKRENLQKLVEHTSLQLLPVTEKIMDTIEVQLNGRKEMLPHILWSIVMDGSVAWNAVKTKLDERVKKGDTKIQNTPWIIYPKHPYMCGTNYFGNPDSQVMLVSITSGYGATTIYKKIKQYQNQLIQSYNTRRPIENANARRTLARYGFVDDKGITKAYIINIDSETARTYKKLSSEFGCEVIEHIDIEKIANQLDVSPGQALVITYHEVCYEILKQLISKGLLEVPAKKDDQIYRLISFVVKSTT